MYNDNLKSIIELLSAGEKRYITTHLVSLQERENNYSTLFKSLSNKNQKGDMVKGMKSANTYYFTRNKLKEKILQLLRNYHNNSTIEQRLRNTLIEVEILFKKRAFDYCKKVITESMALCKRNELFELTLSFISLKLSLLATIEKSKNKINDCYKEIDIMLEKIKDLNYRRQEMHRIFLFDFQKENLRKTAEINKLKKMFAAFQKNDNQKPLSALAQAHRYLSYTMYYRALEDYTKGYDYAKKHLKTIETFKNNSDRDLEDFLIPALGNVLTLELILKKFPEAQSTINKLRATTISSNRTKTAVFLYSWVAETDINIQTGNFKGVKHLDYDIEQRLKKYKFESSEEEIVLYYNMAYLCIGAENYKAALKWINRILNNNKLYERVDVHSFARILNLIIHYHLGNIPLLEYLTLSTYRFLYQKKQIFNIENAILKFIRKVLKTNGSPTELKPHFQDLLLEIKKLSKDPKEQSSLAYFDFISWIESNLQQRPFAEIVKEKALKSNF